MRTIKDFKYITYLSILTLFFILFFSSSSFAASTLSKREWSVKRIQTMSNILWYPKDSTVSAGETISLGEHTFKNLPDTPYRGVPYTQINRETTYTVFQKKLTNIDGKYYYDKNSSSINGELYGMDCSSAVCFAWRCGLAQNSNYSPYYDNFKNYHYVNGTKKYTIYGTRGLLYDAIHTSSGSSTYNNVTYYYRNDIQKVGSYTTATSDLYTPNILSRNGTTVMYNAYNQLKNGDALLYRYLNSSKKAVGHICMVINHNSESKTITILEQLGYNYSNHSDGYTRSTWNKRTYTYEELYNKNYIPIRCIGLDS